MLMKKSVFCITFLIIALHSVHSLDVNAITAALQTSLDLWDRVVPWVRLGAVPVKQDLDPQSVLTALRMDLQKANRYTEFKYLFDFIENKISDGTLVFRVIDEQPPLPGYWPAYISDTLKAVIICHRDLRSTETESAILNGSLLRTIGMLYYFEHSGCPPVYINGRNPLYEFAAFMTGNHLESIYLKDIVNFNSNSEVKTDWPRWLLESAEITNLSEIARRVYGIDMGYAYYFLHKLSELSSTNKVIEILNVMGDMPSGFIEKINQDRYSMYDLSQQSLNNGILARSNLIFTPWILITLNFFVPASNTDFQNCAKAILDQYNTLKKSCSYLESLVLSERQRYLNSLSFRSYDIDVPLLGEKPKTGKNLEPEKLSGTATISWYRECVEYGFFEYRGYLPISNAEARKTSAFRFSYDAQGKIIGIEHFYMGHLRRTEDLNGAARITIYRMGNNELWRWENQNGVLINNDNGFAFINSTITDDYQEYQFYSSNDNRVYHEMGVWSIKKYKLKDGYFYCFLDQAGKSMLNYYGYAFVGYTQNGKYEQIRFYGLDMKPVISNLLGIHGIIITHTKTLLMHVEEKAFIDTNQNICKVYDDYWSSRRIITKDSIVFNILDTEGQPALSKFGFSSMKCVLENGLIVSDSFYNVHEKAENNLMGFHKRTYVYDMYGNLVEDAYFDSQHNPCLGIDGIHHRMMKYDKNGYLEEVFFYNTNGNPMGDFTGAARIRWYRDEFENIIDIDAWDEQGLKMTGRISQDI